MTVAVVITNERQPAQLLSWATQFAIARHTDLKVILPCRGTGERKWKTLSADDDEQNPVEEAVWNTIAELDGLVVVSAVKTDRNTVPESPDSTNHLDHADDESLQKPTASVTVRRLVDPSPGWGIAEESDKLDIQLLIIPAPEHGRKSQSESEWELTIFKTAPCDTMFLHDDEQQSVEAMKTLVVLTDDSDDVVALRYAVDVAMNNDGEVTAVYFEPKQDIYANEVGQRIASRIVKRALGSKADRIQTSVILANSVTDGFQQVDTSEYELILLGSRGQREIKQFAATYSSNQKPGVVEKFPAYATVRGGVPFAGRWLALIQRGIQRIVPQLSRHERIALTEDIELASRWNFDFALLIGLATLIAGFGLIRNSGAVVIGGMLVAPLMHPIVAIGLGLAQSNRQRIVVATRTVFFGFSTAFAMGIVLGLVALFYEFPMTKEINDRGSPNFLDYLIALVSGIAAAYAMGRSHLRGALPGVAIAAALVPPIAAAGIATSTGNFANALGALMLFATNIVAICLGTSFTFWAIGIRGYATDKDERLSNQIRFVLALLVVASIVLTYIMHGPMSELYHDKS